METMWKQRSCNSWLKEGDKNTRFFHAKASNHKQRNRIVGVMDESKIWQDDEDKISEVITAYYQNLFTMLGTYFYVIGISFDKTHFICIWVNLSRFKMIITRG